MSGIDRWILPPEAFCLRKKFPRCIASALRTGVLLPPEDGLRQMIGSYVSRSYLDASGIPDRWKQRNVCLRWTLIAIAHDFKVTGRRIIESSGLKRSPSFAAMQRYVQFRGQSGTSAGMLETTLLTR